MLGAITNSPVFLYLKIGILVAAAAAAGYVAWSVRGAYAEQEIATAVDDAKQQIQKQLDEERALRIQIEQDADARQQELLISISKLEDARRSATTRVTVERKSNPAFYDQPLPQKGLNEWVSARSLIAAQAATGASAPSSPSR